MELIFIALERKYFIQQNEHPCEHSTQQNRKLNARDVCFSALRMHACHGSTKCVRSAEAKGVNFKTQVVSYKTFLVLYRIMYLNN